MSFFGAPAAPVAEAKDLEVGNLPSDSTSALAFSPTQDLLAVASWNNEVRIYEISPQGQSNGKASYAHEGPALCVTWSKDGTKLISGGADKAARVFDLATGQTSQIAVHDAPIKQVKWIDAQGQGLLATGSWDKTIKYWDLRTPTAVASVTLPERLYTMDVAYPLMVVGTAERHIQIFNLSQPTQAFKTLLSPLRWQTRVITCFPDGTGYAVGSVEGRVAIQCVFLPPNSQLSRVRVDTSTTKWLLQTSLSKYALPLFHPVNLQHTVPQERRAESRLLTRLCRERHLVPSLRHLLHRRYVLPLPSHFVYRC